MTKSSNAKLLNTI